MQAAGGLKKRRKKNLAKVTGLTGIQEDYDVFNVDAMYSSVNQNGSKHLNSQRPTRDLRFHVQGISHSDTHKVSALPQINENSDFPYAGKCPRPVLLSDTALTRLKNILMLGVASFSFPWKWNSTTHTIDTWVSPGALKLWKIVWTLVTMQSTAIFGFQIYSFTSRLHTMRDPDGSYRPVFMNSFSVLWYAYAVSLNLCMHYFRDEILGYINTLLNFNKKLVDLYVIDLSEYQEGGQIFLNLSIPSNISQTFVSITLFLVMPFQPWYLTSYVYSGDQPWWFLIPGCVQEFLFVGQVLSTYLLIGWVIVVHANSVEFWPREAHRHNETGFTTDGIRNSESAMALYRSLQLLNVQFNSAMASAAIPIVKVTNWTALIPCGYVLIRSMNRKFLNEFPGILTYPVSVIDCATTSYAILQLGAEMCDISLSFLNSWSCTKHQDFRRVLISCPMLKVRISGFYSLSVSTTITFFKSCFDYIIDTIVTFG